MAINKVEYSNTTLIDITDTTATANTVLVGSAFYDNSGTKVNGGVSFISYYTGSSAPSSSLGSDGDIYVQI